ncbi:alpha/beta hydrolase [Halostella sp. JP-L12]|uniref:alpha/beta hydrolase n=1 Tax=Halostella TaxID=1843185 RepID=UPI000EF7E84C|nr:MULTISPECIES: alpha/beta hydrolase [Halostella]NHN48860.1 alpha/beta hydrolase [Halostella sp. JP-L12]
MRTDLDPGLAECVATVERLGVTEWSALSVSEARRVEDEAFGGGDPPELASVRDLTVDGPEGEIPVRVYRPDVETPAQALVFYHGGGWVLGTLDSADDLCRRFARRAGCAVVSVDYRLAPEHPFPAADDDAYTALERVVDDAAAFGVDPERVGVAGTSAGGNLAAATALRARDEGGPPVAQQVLCYPMTGRRFDAESYDENADGPLLTRRDVEWFWDLYLDDADRASDPYAVPLRADDHAGLPPATVVTGGHDPLRDEGVEYAERLADAGVPVDHLHYPSAVHGFLSMADEATVADRAFDETAASIRERF